MLNSIVQLKRFASFAQGKPIGLRLNPGVSCAGFDLADPAREFSRLGEGDPDRILDIVDQLDGVMIHNNCENNDFARFDERSEARRVGKECVSTCRSRWSPHHEKKNTTTNKDN